MAERRIINAIKYLKKCVEENGVRVERVVLFGSHANGTCTADSDIDVVIVSEDFKGKSVFERAAMTGNAEWAAVKKYRISFDIVTMTSDELENGVSPVAGFAREGKVVFAA